MVDIDNPTISLPSGEFKEWRATIWDFDPVVRELFDLTGKKQYNPTGTVIIQQIGNKYRLIYGYEHIIHNIILKDLTRNQFDLLMGLKAERKTTYSVVRIERETHSPRNCAKMILEPREYLASIREAFADIYQKGFKKSWLDYFDPELVKIIGLRLSRFEEKYSIQLQTFLFDPLEEYRKLSKPCPDCSLKRRCIYCDNRIHDDEEGLNRKLIEKLKIILAKELHFPKSFTLTSVNEKYTDTIFLSQIPSNKNGHENESEKQGKFLLYVRQKLLPNEPKLSDSSPVISKNVKSKL